MRDATCRADRINKILWELARAWPGAELIIIEDSGHTGSTTMTEQMHAAADRLYEQITNPA